MLKLTLNGGYILVVEDTSLEAIIIERKNDMYIVTLMVGYQFNYIYRCKNFTIASLYCHLVNERIKKILQTRTGFEVFCVNLESMFQNSQDTVVEWYTNAVKLYTDPETGKVDEVALGNAWDLMMKPITETEDTDAKTKPL